MSEKIKKYRIYIFEVLFFAALLAVDLISKAAAFAFLEKKGGSYVVFEGIYELIEVHNDGASFGIFGGQTTMLSIFTAIAIVGGEAEPVWCYPCGVCRQVMAEFCSPDTFQVICAKATDEYRVFTLGQLLPEMF